MRGGKEINGNRKVEQRMQKGKTRIGKTFTQCKKGSAEGKVGKISRKIVRSRTQNEGRREKSGLHRAKNGSSSSKNRPKSGSEWRKTRKTEILERKRWGGGVAKKRALLPILQCYEVTKWAQMKFSRIFFRRSLAGNAEMPYLCTRNREATLLQERVTL